MSVSSSFTEENKPGPVKPDNNGELAKPGPVKPDNNGKLAPCEVDIDLS